MTTIPPNWLGSIIQSQGAQERASQAKNAEEAKGTERGAFSDKLRDVIENNDRDVEVYSDAEGAGSQGSPFSEAEPQDELDEATEEQEQPDTGAGLDLEA
jgi:hypothetical protein